MTVPPVSTLPPANPVPPESEDVRPATPIAFGPLLEILVTHRRLILGNTVLCLLLGLAAALVFLRPVYTVSLQLSRYEPPLATDSFKPQPLNTAAVFGMVSSPDALLRTRSQLTPPLTANQLARRLELSEDRQSELITVTARGGSALEAITLANLFATDAVAFTQALQRNEALEAGRLVARQLESNDADRTALRQQLSSIEGGRAIARQQEQAARQLARATTPAKVDHAKINRLDEKAQAVRDTLSDLQARYTEAHPLVREQQARLAAIEAQLKLSVQNSRTDTTPAPGPVGAVDLATDEAALAPEDQSTGYDALAGTLGALEVTHAALVDRQRAIALFAVNPPGYLHPLHVAGADHVVVRRNRLTVAALALLGAVLGAFATIGAIAIGELLDDRLKTGADVARVTRLPLLATLGNLATMTPANQAGWGFRTWTALQRHLSVSPNHGLVCGFTSSGPGEGRSTWIDLLAKAARKCGFTVLTISSSPAGSPKPEAATPGIKPTEPPAPVWGTTAFTAMVLTNPAHLLEKLMAPNPSPFVSLPLPGGWVWDLERRKQWQHALNSWRGIENVAIFVELPPVSDPETVLLAENMPNVIWLAESHKAQAAETIDQLETLHNARCRLVGAVLNREPVSPVRRRFARWFGRRTAIAASAFGLVAGSASAQLAVPAPVPPPASSVFAAVDPAQRAPWQQRLTLGPGDLLNLSVYGQPELSQLDVPVGPDGRISYLEAQNVVAAGLTVDEFRAELNRELAKSRNAPEVIVIPASYRSKKYYVLGAVTQKGAFPLTRPLTIIEAVAEAGGLEMGLADRSQVVQADLSRSFLARQGTHLAVDFEKLFLEGDLTQNVTLEPNDYLYFAPGERSQVFVLGEVRFPGPLVLGARTGTLAAIAVRGGFSDRAWRTRLLVVRGSLDRPQTFVINATDVLAAKAVDFPLQARDIVYVSSRPWIRAEELLDDAASAFVQAAAITTAGLHAYPIGGR